MYFLSAYLSNLQTLRRWNHQALLRSHPEDKTLYGILLDRMSLSARNGWLDKAGRVFIIYTVQEVQDSLGCADKKATKLLRELEEYGLIERKRRGLGKPDLIYVKNFSSESSKLRFLNRDNDDSGVVQNTLQDPAKLRCNKTERNNTEISDTDPISSDENDWMSEREQLEEYFSQSSTRKAALARPLLAKIWALGWRWRARKSCW